ncbi:MAG: ABC transporter permease [Steroidobacteraceae bacterium]
MKYLPLVWAGIWRQRGRAILMLLQIASAFVLFGTLQGFDAGVDRTIADSHRDRLYVESRVALDDPLPIGMLAKIRSVPDVERVAERADFGGTYQRPNQYIPAAAVNADVFFGMYPEAKVSRGGVAALERDRAGAIVGLVTMRKYGWKVGEHVVIDSTVPKLGGSHDWGFDIVGTYDVSDHPTDSVLIITNLAYFNEERLTGPNHVNFFVAQIANPADADAIALAIDNAFANSPNETHTESGAELAVAQFQQLGDLDFIVHGVIGAVFFALLLATGALMMQSIRERVPELAVMKTIGFTDRRLLALLLAESVVFCVAAGAIGLGIGSALLPLARRDVGITIVPGIMFAEGIACAVLLAVLAAWIPARRGARLAVADALAGR